MAKSLKMLNNVERAKILAELFPEFMFDMVDMIEKVATMIIEDKQNLEKDWGRNIVSFPMWLQLAENAKRRIEADRKMMAAKPRRFADQLFDGYDGIFGAHCLLELTKVHKDEKLVQAINLYFGV